MGEHFAFLFYLFIGVVMILDYLIHKLTEEKPPEICADKCINSYSSAVECSKCTEICPEGAAKFKGKKVIFDEKLCSNCGICKAKCPTQAIKVKNTGEESILNHIGEKKNPVFSCSMEGAAGNLNISCLNAMHPEFISALFILYKDKKLYFNTSSCTKCEMGYNDSVFRDALDKSLIFVKRLGISPVYEILSEEADFSDLLDEEISRRNLFKLVTKESRNIALKTITTIIDEDEQLSVRKLLLKAIQNIEIETDKPNTFWEYWNVNADCDGCGKCKSVCPGKAWKIENNDTSIQLYHSSGNCYKCGLCKTVCPKKAIAESVSEIRNSLEFVLKREIKLNTCKVCNKKFIYDSEKDEVCDVCRKKELLRKKISTSLS